jgi:hypothetical protein
LIVIFSHCTCSGISLGGSIVKGVPPNKWMVYLYIIYIYYIIWKIPFINGGIQGVTTHRHSFFRKLPFSLPSLDNHDIPNILATYSAVLSNTYRYLPS